LGESWAIRLIISVCCTTKLSLFVSNNNRLYVGISKSFSSVSYKNSQYNKQIVVFITKGMTGYNQDKKKPDTARNNTSYVAPIIMEKLTRRLQVHRYPFRINIDSNFTFALVCDNAATLTIRAFVQEIDKL